MMRIKGNEDLVHCHWSWDFMTGVRYWRVIFLLTQGVAVLVVLQKMPAAGRSANPSQQRQLNPLFFLATDKPQDEYQGGR